MRVTWVQTSAPIENSAHFLEAFQARSAAGLVEFKFIDQSKFMPSRRSLAEKILSRVIGRPIAGYHKFNRALIDSATQFKPHVVLIAKGSYFPPETLRLVKQRSGALLVNWATDDPLNVASASANVRASIPLFDLYVCTKRAIMEDVERAGCPNVAYVMFGYKPTVHFPEAPRTDEERLRFECDVAFVGSPDANRTPYFEHLVQALPNLKLHLYGGGWVRYPALERSQREPALVSRDYRMALGGAKIAINLVRRSNRDDHVQRTFELPACGVFMLAERTATHVNLFDENREAVFFDSAADLATKVRIYLERDTERRRIAEAGRRKVIDGQHTYADRLDQILEIGAELLRQRDGSAAWGRRAS